MIVKAYFGPIGVLMLAAGLGFITLARLPEHGHLIAWVLITIGAAFGMVTVSAGTCSRQS